MTLLLPDPRPRMGLEQTHRRRCVDACRFGGVELDAAEVFGADEAVLVGADQSGRRAVVAVERTAIETLCDEHVLREGVLDRHDRAVAVETAEDDMSDRGARSNGRLDERSVERLERNSLPPQRGCRPARDAMEVGDELSPGKRREQLERQDEGLRHLSSDLDRRLGGDWRNGSAEVRTESRESVDRTLSRWKRHAAPEPGCGEDVRQACSSCRMIAGYTMRCRNGPIAAMYAAPNRPFGFT